MKISELIKEVTKDYMPLYKEIKQIQKEGNQVNEKEAQRLFELSTKLELFKVLKSLFMEEITKNDKVFPVMLANKLITTRQDEAEKDGKKVKVTVVNESMDYQIDNLPEEFIKPILEEMVKSHKKNLESYKNNPELLKKEQYELEVLESFLPKEATQEDVMEYLNEYYPSGIERKSMGLVIKEVKAAFERVDGKMVAQCVNTKIVG